MKIPFARVDCSGMELENIKGVLESGWLTTASKAQEFEKKIGALVGAKHAIAVNSCTSALHLALEAMGIKEGDRVLVPTWTFSATATVVCHVGAEPVFIDVDYGTSSLTPEIVEKAIQANPDVKALIPVHFAGHPCEMISSKNGLGILDVCRKYGVKVIEDAAHSFPSRLGELNIGSISDATCFSFYANKTLTTGEGGMLLTNDDDIAKRARLMRLHGIDRDVWDRFNGTGSSWEYDIAGPGYKYNLPDVNAAIGLAQLDRVELMRNQRQKCAEFYFSSLSTLKCLDLPVVTIPYSDHSWHLFPIVLNQNTRVERDELIQLLADDGIGTSVHYKPLHRMKYFKEKYGLEVEDFPVAEKLWKGCLSLPLYSLLEDAELAYIVDRLKHHLAE